MREVEGVIEGVIEGKQLVREREEEIMYWNVYVCVWADHVRIT